MRKYLFPLLLTTVVVAAWGADVELKLATPRVATLTEDACLHLQPTDDSDLVMCLMTGAKLKLVSRMKGKVTSEGKSGYWYKAELQDGQVGWIFSTKFKVEEESKGGKVDPADVSGGAPPAGNK